MAGFVFNIGALALQDGTIDWQAATIRARLSEQSETLSKDASVLTGLGLPATDIAVTGRTGPTVNLTSDRVTYSSDAFAFPSVAEGPRTDKAIVFAFVTNDSDSIPIAVVTITNPVLPNTGGIRINIDPTGMFYTQQ